MAINIAKKFKCCSDLAKLLAVATGIINSALAKIRPRTLIAKTTATDSDK